MKVVDKHRLEVGIYFIPELTCGNNLPFSVSMPSVLDPIELSSSNTYNDVAILVASLLEFCDLNFDSKFFRALVEPHELALVGGLGFSRNNSYIGPSCCSEFQDWRGVRSSLERRESYWMGHDPEPYFEFSGSRIVLWNDEPDAQVRFSIDFSIDEFRVAEIKAQKKLEGFANVAKEWATKEKFRQVELFITGIEDYLFNSHHYL